MKKPEVGDVVINEYNNVGILIAIEGHDEAQVDVVNNNILDDIDYCSYAKCRLATEKEIEEAVSKLKTK